MKPLSAALLLLGGVLQLVALPLQWSAVVATNGSASVASTGLDYPGYDIATSAAIGVLLIAAAFTVTGGWRWASIFAVVIALIACLWAALVYLAAGYPANGGSTAGVTVTVGAGAYVAVAGAVLALIGSVLSFRGRGVAAVRSGAQPSI
jgi:hypothetical protein